MTENVLVVAFDGMDKELIEEFDLENIPQGEFGSIDNDSGIKLRKTSELFASFITGETHDEHSVTGLKFDPNLLARSIPDYLKNNVRGFQSIFDLVSEDREVRFPTKADLPSTIFDRIDNSRALFVPSYNPSPFWICNGTGLRMRKYDVEDRALGYYWDEMERKRRKEEFLRPVNRWYDFTMMHFHRVDVYQHIYGDEASGNFDKEKLEEVYQESDKLAGEILDFFGEDYDYIIFMLDHGLPTENQHNKNAFYSCNRELFGTETPHITDFHDKIFELTGNEDELE